MLAQVWFYKLSGVRTLMNKAQQVITMAEDRTINRTGTRVHNTFRINKYPEWALAPPSPSAKRSLSTNNNPPRPMLGLPYVAGLSEQLRQLYKSHNVHIYHKPANTLRSMILHPKEKTPKEHQCGTIYNITFDNDRDHSGRVSKNTHTCTNEQA